MGSWSSGELLAVAASRLIVDADTCFVGLGLPQVAAVLAKRTHAPAATLLLEIGVFEPMPTQSAMGIADPRLWEGAGAFGSVGDVLGTMLHGGRVSLGLLGALQVDPAGSINTTRVTDNSGGVRRFNGSGGGNDIASLAGRVVVLVRHDSRRFREHVEFLTSPGHRVGERTRTSLGLPGRGTVAIVTDRAVLEIGPDGATLAELHPGERADEVLAATPMPVRVPDGGPREGPPPSAEQLALIRDELDPDRWYTAGR